MVVLRELDGARQVVGPGPLLADVDLVHCHGHLVPQRHSVDLVQAHLTVAVVVQASHEVDNYCSPDVHLERVILPVELEPSRLGCLPAVCRLNHDRVVKLRVPPGPERLWNPQYTDLIVCVAVHLVTCTSRSFLICTISP